MSKFKITFFAVYAFAIGLIVYKANPHFYFIGDQYYEILNSPPQSPATLLNKIESTCQATDQYRHTAYRSGVQKESQPQAQVKVVKHIYPLNVGIHGASKASPAIDESGIYLGSDTGFFWKLNFEGEIQWRFYAGKSRNGFHGTAALDDKKVYIGAYDGFMYALDKNTGKLSWANPVGDFIGASPLLADNALFISVETANPNGFLTKLDCNTGETLWNSQWFGGHSHSSPSFDGKSRSVIAGANSGRAFGIHSETGKTLWEQQYGGPIKGTPLVHEGVAYFGAWDKKYHAIDIKNGRKIWSLPVGGRTQSSMTLVPELNLGITNTPIGRLVAIDLKSGEVRWSDQHGDKNHIFSVLVTSRKGALNKYLAWSRCGEGQLCVYDAQSGKRLHKLKLPGAFTGVPVAYKNRIYISLIDNHGMVILE